MLVVFEGMDGSGKSTVLGETVEILLSRNYDAVGTKEPGSPHVPVCVELRKILLNKDVDRGQFSELMLYMVDRAEHFRQFIQPNQSKIILCDRNHISTEIYQIAVGMEYRVPDELIKLHQAIAEVPDAYVFIDVPLELAIKRMEMKRKKVQGDKESRFDDLPADYHMKIHQLYRERMANTGEKGAKKIVLDGKLPSRKLAEQAADFILEVDSVRVR